MQFQEDRISLIKCVKSAMFSKMVNQQFVTLRTNISVQDCLFYKWSISLHWRHNGPDGVSNHQPHDCSLSRLFRQRSKKASKLRVTGLCAGNSPGTGEFPAQMASYTENVSIWWRHHVVTKIFVIVRSVNASHLYAPIHYITQFCLNEHMLLIYFT